MENIVKVLNAVKNFNEIKNLKNEVKENNKKSREYMESCKRIVTENQTIHEKEIKEKEKQIEVLNKQIEEQKSMMVVMNEENKRIKKILNRIPKWILFLFKRRRV